MNSIMFPTIFSLACEKLGPRAADGSGIINIAIFGGAVVPVLTGLLADKSGSLQFALLLPALCYAVIGAFGIYARRPAEGPVMKAADRLASALEDLDPVGRGESVERHVPIVGGDRVGRAAASASRRRSAAPLFFRPTSARS